MPYYNRDPKRDHNFDNHPYIYIYMYIKRHVQHTSSAASLYILVRFLYFILYTHVCMSMHSLLACMYICDFVIHDSMYLCMRSASCQCGGFTRRSQSTALLCEACLCKPTIQTATPMLRVSSLGLQVCKGCS